MTVTFLTPVSQNVNNPFKSLVLFLSFSFGFYHLNSLTKWKSPTQIHYLRFLELKIQDVNPSCASSRLVHNTKHLSISLEKEITTNPCFSFEFTNNNWLFFCFVYFIRDDVLLSLAQQIKSSAKCVFGTNSNGSIQIFPFLDWVLIGQDIKERKYAFPLAVVIGLRNIRETQDGNMVFANNV